ncbi:MAG: GerMN domain-containing protein [Candidatus Sumerlaeia bacterium]|nr:GerMN domain-containing protein [Candidatus Sumerlaeia bacterium]
MTQEKPHLQTEPNGVSNAAPARAFGRVIAVSVLVLLAGLGAMWAHFAWKEPAGVGLESAGDRLPEEQNEPAASNRVRLLFTADGTHLSPELSEIRQTRSVYEHTSAVLQLLLRGPRSGKLRSPIPPGVRARALFLHEGVATIDFSAELRENLHAGPNAEILCIYSIVNTLILNSRQIKSVAFLIEGRPVETLAGYLDLSEPLIENLALNAGEKTKE